MKRIFSRLHAQRGFTLTEFAITIGMVAFIMGAIWIAYSQAILDYNATRLGNDVTQILVNYSNSSAFGYSSFPSTVQCSSYTCNDPVTHLPTTPPTICYWGGASNGGSGYPTAAVANARAGLIPIDMLNNPTNPTAVNNFFGGTFSTFYASGSGACTSGSGTQPASSYTITLSLGNIPSQACTQILIANKDRWLQYGFSQICTNNCEFSNWFGAAEPGLTLANAVAACSISNPVGLILDFNFPMVAGY